VESLRRTVTNVLFVGWNDGNIRAFTPQSGKLIFTIYNAHIKGVSAIALTRNGKKLITGGGEGQVVSISFFFNNWLINNLMQILR
jgi:WD40 repeat protein